jgi:hypothetical protein
MGRARCLSTIPRPEFILAEVATVFPRIGERGDEAFQSGRLLNRQNIRLAFGTVQHSSHVFALILFAAPSA